MADDSIHVDPMVDYQDLDGDGEDIDHDQFEDLDSMASSEVSFTTKLQSMTHSVALPKDQPSSDAPKAVLKRKRQNVLGIMMRVWKVAFQNRFEILCKNSLLDPNP